MNKKAFLYGIFYILLIGIIVSFNFEKELIIFLGIPIVGYYFSLIFLMSSKIFVKILFFIVSVFSMPTGLFLIDYFLKGELFNIEGLRYLKWVEFGLYLLIFFFIYVLTTEILLNQLRLLRLEKYFITSLIYTLFISIFSGIVNYIYLLGQKFGYGSKENLRELLKLSREYFQSNIINISVFSLISFLTLGLFLIYSTGRKH